MPTIFIVEDNVPLAQLYTKFLVYTGAAVTHVGSCREAFAYLDEGNVPDVILLDISLPDGDGLSIAEHLRTRPEFQHTQIVLASAHEDYHRTAKKLGIEHFFCKPVSVPSLTECVKKLLLEAKPAPAFSV